MCLLRVIEPRQRTAANCLVTVAVCGDDNDDAGCDDDFVRTCVRACTFIAFQFATPHTRASVRCEPFGERSAQIENVDRAHALAVSDKRTGRSDRADDG